MAGICRFREVSPSYDCITYYVTYRLLSGLLRYMCCEKKASLRDIVYVRNEAYYLNSMGVGRICFVLTSKTDGAWLRNMNLF